ncbi:MAG: biotin/lipoyl-containing protein [Rikenellaceae bacterium]
MKEYKMKINGNKYAVSVNELEENIATVTVNGVVYNVELERDVIKKTKTPKVVQRRVPMAQDVAPAAAPRPAAAPSAGGKTINSPLPGVILDVFVKEGDSVKVGQRLMILEAMKMENNIECDVDGVVTSVKRKGDSVLEGDSLIVIG